MAISLFARSGSLATAQCRIGASNPRDDGGTRLYLDRILHVVLPFAVFLETTRGSLPDPQLSAGGQGSTTFLLLLQLSSHHD